MCEISLRNIDDVISELKERGVSVSAVSLTPEIYIVKVGVFIYFQVISFLFIYLFISFIVHFFKLYFTLFIFMQKICNTTGGTYSICRHESELNLAISRFEEAPIW